MAKRETQEGELLPATVEGQAKALVAIGHDNPILATLNQIMEKGVTNENAEALDKICGLYERMEALAGRRAFTAAKAALQAELPSVMATKAIPSKDGTVRSTFAPYEEIMATVQPYLVKHGFSVAFTIRVDADGKRLAAVCTLSHVGGHSESNEFSVRVGGGPPGCSETQADGAARSYARRGALCDALNIVVDHDTDARLEGAVVPPEVAKELAAAVKAAGLDERAFLDLADADSFATIREGRVAMLREAIQQGAKAMPAPDQNADLKSAVNTLAARFVRAKFKGGEKPDKAIVWQEFKPWVESVIERSIASGADLTAADVEQLEAWFAAHGARPRTDADREPGQEG
jgi:hypothetical protein